MFDTREKRERRLGAKLLLKAERCNSPKCATVRRPYPPGIHGKKRGAALTEYGQQLQEKQKVKFTYGIREAQMKKIFMAAAKNPGVTGEMIISLLERRLDNVVFRLGLALSRSIARQLINHGHILINNRKTRVPSYQVNIGDIITIRPQSKDHRVFKDLAINLKRYEPPIWLIIDKEKFEGKILSLPKDFEIPFDINMVVDYYLK
jgi:small subunit ribosomal protein S4